MRLSGSSRAFLASVLLLCLSLPALAQSYTAQPLPPPVDDPDLPPPLPAPVPAPPPTYAAPPVEDHTPPSPMPSPRLSPAGVVTSSDFIARCLCARQRVESLHRQSQDAQHRFDEAQKRLNALNQHMNQSRDQIDPNDEIELEAFRHLVEEDERVNAHLFNELLPRTQAIVKRYNGEVQDYNAQCAGQSFDPGALQRATDTLSCAPIAEPLGQP
jgi:hypothetical protein